MKLPFFISLSIVIFSFSFFPKNAFAVNTTPLKVEQQKKENLKQNTSISSKTKKTKEDRIQKRLKKKTSRLKKWMNKVKSNFEVGSVIDLRDPVKKWLWFGIFLWALALIATILFYLIPGVNVLQLISGLLGLGGLVCLVIWLVKFLS